MNWLLRWLLLQLLSIPLIHLSCHLHHQNTHCWLWFQKLGVRISSYSIAHRWRWRWCWRWNLMIKGTTSQCKSKIRVIGWNSISSWHSWWIRQKGSPGGSGKLPPELEDGKPAQKAEPAATATSGMFPGELQDLSGKGYWWRCRMSQTCWKTSHTLKIASSLITWWTYMQNLCSSHIAPTKEDLTLYSNCLRMSVLARSVKTCALSPPEDPTRVELVQLRYHVKTTLRRCRPFSLSPWATKSTRSVC